MWRCKMKMCEPLRCGHEEQRPGPRPHELVSERRPRAEHGEELGALGRTLRSALKGLNFRAKDCRVVSKMINDG
jgi:hypothetical protein